MTERWLSEMSAQELRDLLPTLSAAADGTGPIPGTHMRAECDAIAAAINAELWRRDNQNR